MTAAAPAGSRALVEGCGADRFLDYGAKRFENAVDGMDIVYDTLGGEMQERSWGLLNPGGILVSTVQPPDPGQAEAHASAPSCSAPCRMGRSWDGLRR